MAKRNIHKGQQRPFTSNGERSKKNENTMRYTSALGTEVVFYPLPPMLEEKIELSLAAEWPRPLPPTYTMKTATGRDEVRPHDETTLETAEDRAAWAAYQADKAAWEEEKGKRFLRAIQVQCIKPADPDDEEWIEQQAFLGIKVPENRFERHLHYIETQVIGDEDDIMACLTIPMQLMAKATDEEMKSAEAMFRNAVSEEAIKRRTAQSEG